jgi:hypothetical protein
MKGAEERNTDLAVGDDAAALLERGLSEEDLLADHSVVLVIGVVGVPELAVGAELELEKLMAELALVADVVADVELAELVRGGCRHRCPRPPSVLLLASLQLHLQLFE